MNGSHLSRVVLRAILPLVLAAAVVMLPASAGAQEPAAVLAVVSGGVNIIRGDDVLDASFGATLEAGDIVETGGDAEAAVLFESGQIIELGPGSRITISGVPQQDEGAVVAQVADAFSGDLGRFARTSSDQGLSSLPTLRSRSEHDRPIPVAPRNTLVSSFAQRFTWTPVEEALEYRFILTSPDGAAQTHATENTYIEEPEGIGWLNEAGRWSWSVEAVTDYGPIRSEEVVIELASQEQWKDLERLMERLAPMVDSDSPTQSDAAHYLVGSYARSSGFYADAIAHLELLVSHHPDRRELHQELGSLYELVGLNHKAAESYRLALRE